MQSLLKRQGKRIPLIGDMVCSILVLPLTFHCLDKWLMSLDFAIDIMELCTVYATAALVHLFRAFRLRERSRAEFIAHLIYGCAFGISGALAGITYSINGSITESMSLDMIRALALVFWAWALSDRVMALILRRSPWHRGFNLCVTLVLLYLMYYSFKGFPVPIELLLLVLWALISVMAFSLSGIRLDVFINVVRKSYAVQIISGMMLQIVAFSYVLTFADPQFKTYEDALWYCFAVVTTIGFGDVTPITFVGRLLTAILGIYGIVVFALITSIIVTFYHESKNDRIRRARIRGKVDDSAAREAPKGD